ncbi:hypothetical protein R80B4_00329 [Fibrobacteres bacterium R8-0-B4]
MKNIFKSCGTSASAALRRRVFVCAYVLAVGLSAAPVALFAQDPMISTEVSARGRREHLIRADEWGRYAVEAKSAEGAAVEVVDKLRGVIASCEATADKDGRLNLFLEAGEYKVFTEGPRNATGNVRLEVTKFTPFDTAGEGSRGNGGKNRYGYLAPFGKVTTRLVDKEARGWWIFVPRDTIVFIEAIGRRLNGLAVFRGGERLIASAGDGLWETTSPASSAGFQSVGVPGKPLFGLRIAKRLERGKYLVLAYGGAEDKYGVADNASPLYVQWMIRPVEPGRPINGKIGASGMIRYVANPSDGLTHVIVESPKMQKLAIKSGALSESGMTERYGEETLYPKPQSACCQAMTIRVNDSGTVITLSGAPETEFKITPVNHSVESYKYKPEADGAYQLSALYTTVMGTGLGMSGAFIDMKDSSIIALKTDTVAPSRSIRRQFNITGTQWMSAFVWISEAGVYAFTPGNGVGYQWRVKRFYIKTPQNYNPPTWDHRRGSVTLAKGLHEIEIMPGGEKGSAEFSFGSGGNNASDQQAAASPKITLGPVDLKKGREYRFYYNSIPSERASIVIDKYPPPAKENVADVYLTGAAADKADSASSRASQTAELATGVPRYVTLGKRGSADFRFKIKELGIYKVETTGRLHTKLTLRDRFGGMSKSQSGNGVGRNALVTEFFLPGDYLAVVETMGESAGRTGVVMSKGELRKGGTLQDGVDKRAAVKANSAVVYDFKADKKGRYRFESFGAAGGEEIRLEDSDGWPLIPHGSEAPQKAELEKGSYKLYTLPSSYENYRLTRFDAVREPLKITGAGPHGIAVNEPVTAMWLESGSGAPARFLFEVSAPIEAKVFLTPDFKGTLKPQGSKEAAPISVSGEYSGVLQKGKYEIAVTPLKPQNYSPYELSVETSDLIPGIGYEVDKDKTLRVQVGERGGYDIYSQGRGEVSARLYASDNKTEIARSGGDQLDWNFFISERLDSGSYNLRLSGFESNPAKVVMRRTADTVMSPITLEAAAEKRNVPLSWKQVVIPITSQSGDVLSITASGGSRIVCELEAADKQFAAKQGGAAAQIVWPAARRRGKRVNIAAVVEKGAVYTLRIWSEDRIDDVAAVEIKAATAIPLTFESARSGVAGQASNEEGNTVFYRIDGMDAGPGHYELIASENEIIRVSGVNAPEDEAAKGQPRTEANKTSGGGAASGVFEEGEGMLIASAGRRLFVEAVFKSPDKFRFAIVPVAIADVRDIQEKNADKSRGSKTKYAEREELPVMIKSGGSKAFVIDGPAQKLGVVTLTMPAGQPIAGLSAPPQSAEFVRNGVSIMGGQYISSGVSKTAVIPGDTGRIVGWNAQTGGSAAAGVNAVFAMKSYKMEKTDTLKTGRTVWAAKPSLAKEFRVSQAGGAAIATIKLSPYVGAVYVSPDGKRDLYYGGDDGAQYTITPAGGRLFLFGKTDGGGDGSIELEMYASPQTGKKDDAQKSVLTAGSESIKIQPVDTRETFRVKNGTQQALRLLRSGSIESADWVSKSGAMTRNVTDGGKLTGESGVLLVSYNAGVGKLKLCKDDGNLNACLWGGPVGKSDSTAVIREISRLTMAHGVNLYTVELSEPAHVSLSAATPAAAMVSTDGKIGAYREFWETLRWDIPLSAGKHIVGLKPITSGSLFGIPLTVGIYPILQLTEAKPLRMQIMASQNRLAKFELQKKSKIGIGLSTQGQTVEAALLDATGKEIAAGSQIFKELDKGAYYVSLSVPFGSTQNGVSVTVRLFGQDNPPADPPIERINRIIKDDRSENSTAQTSR